MRRDRRRATIINTATTIGRLCDVHQPGAFVLGRGANQAAVTHRWDVPLYSGTPLPRLAHQGKVVPPSIFRVEPVM